MRVTVVVQNLPGFIGQWKIAKKTRLFLCLLPLQRIRLKLKWKGTSIQTCFFKHIYMWSYITWYCWLAQDHMKSTRLGPIIFILDLLWMWLTRGEKKLSSNFPFHNLNSNGCRFHDKKSNLLSIHFNWHCWGSLGNKTVANKIGHLLCLQQCSRYLLLLCNSWLNSWNATLLGFLFLPPTR